MKSTPALRCGTDTGADLHGILNMLGEWPEGSLSGQRLAEMEGLQGGTMTYQEMELQAIQKRDQLASITESMGLQLTKLSRSFFPAFAIAFDETESSICSTVPAEPNLVLFSSGVLHTIPVSPALYCAVNTANRELGVGRFMVGTNTEEPGLASVFYQLGAFAHLVTESDYLRFCLTFSAKQGVDGRETLAREGISGRPYGWNSDDVDRLYLQHAV